MFEMMPLALFGTFVALAWSIAVNVAIAYGAAWVAGQIAGKPKSSAPSFGNYPFQHSEKGGCVPRLLGTLEIASNVIWMGDQNVYEKKVHVPHQKEHVRVMTYYKSFLLCLGEGPMEILKCWKGSTEIPLSDFTQFTGANNSGIKDLTGEDFGEYQNDCLAYFHLYDTGVSPTIPNFTFECRSLVSYKYTYISENGKIWGVPVLDRQMLTLDNGGVAVSIGGGIVGLPCEGQPFKSGEVLRLTGTSNYNGTHTLTAGTTEDQLQFADSFNAETFDGTEIPVKQISLTSSAGRMVQDASGNLYYGHNWSAGNSTYVTKIELDGTLVYDFLNPDNWPFPGAGVVLGLALSTDSQFIYIYVDNRVSKYSLVTGNKVWDSVIVGSTGFDLSVDADGNAYATMSGDDCIKLASADGSQTSLTDMGDNVSIVASGGCPYVSVVDEDMGLVIVAGKYSTGLGFPDDVLYNLAVRTFDDSVGDQITVGDDIIGVNRSTPLIGTGMLATRDGFIYVITADPTIRLFKISWDGSNLAVVKTADGPPYGVGLHFDLWGNLVVVNQDAITGQDDVLWFYDTDLTFISKIEGMYTSMLTTWDAAAGGSWIQGNVVFSPGLDSDNFLDVNPADMILDLAESERYGVGSTGLVVNEEKRLAAWTYWQEQGMLLSINFNSQRPFTDWVDYILSMCDGFRWTNGSGELCLGVFKEETANPDDDILDRDWYRENPDDPGVDVVERPQSDLNNKVIIGCNDRENGYGEAFPVAEDAVHQRINGVSIHQIDMSGIQNPLQGKMMAYRTLVRALYRFNIYTGRVSFKHMNKEIGMVCRINEGANIIDQQVRILNTEEDVDAQLITLTMIEDEPRHYPQFAYLNQEDLRPPDWENPPVIGDGTIAFYEEINQRQIQLAISPSVADTSGYLIYRSYDDINFEFIGRTIIESVPLVIANSTGTITGFLPAHPSVTWAQDESISVTIGIITDLKTTITDDEFWNNRYLAKISDEVISFKLAVESSTEGTWTISNLRRGLLGTEPVAHYSGETFSTLIVDYTYTYPPEEVAQTLYFKALAYWGASSEHEQSLSDVSSVAIQIQGYIYRPVAAACLRLSANVSDGGSGVYSGPTLTLYWNLGSKVSGLGVGGHDVSPSTSSWFYPDVETLLIPGGGALFGNYIEDPELQMIVLRFEQEDGTVIGEREIAVAESETITKATDLGGFNPARITVVPRRSLHASDENSILVDDGS